MNIRHCVIGLFSLAAALLLSSCMAPRGAYDPSYDFAKIRTVKVGDFSAPGKHSNAGSVIQGEFMRQMLSMGYIVKSAESNDADVILEGSVTEFLPNRRYLVQNTQKDAKGNIVVVQQNAVEIGGSNVYNLGAAFGADGTQILVSNATVGISSYLKDAKTGQIIWSNTYTYEGLDLNSAMEGAVRYLVTSIPKKRT
jgi:hypothetical protein